jgi:ABC-2 type transport system permease protein
MKLLAVLHKEALLLARDIAGLVILFVMPVFLVMVVTLAQEGTLDAIEETKISLLFVDNDRGRVGSIVERGLADSGFFTVISEREGGRLTVDDIVESIARGDYQIGCVTPGGAKPLAQRRAGERARRSMADARALEEYFRSGESLAGITVYFDPAVRDSYRNAVTSSLHRLVQGAEMRLLIDNFFTIFKAEMEREIARNMEKHGKKDIAMNVPDIHFPWRPGSLIIVKEVFAGKKEARIVPSMVQNNVPGFALFAMFFIVIPLSGSLITERGSGTASRLRSLPVAPLTLMAGKIVLYTAVCLMQLALMIAVGVYVLPLIGIEPLVMGSNWGALAAAALASALAAVGFGMAVGSLTGSIAQASMFGSVMVVIMAVMGGLMIPVYLMPRALDVAGSFISPIRWGIDAFLDLFVRGGDMAAIASSIIRLVAFFVACVIVSLLASRARR